MGPDPSAMEETSIQQIVERFRQNVPLSIRVDLLGPPAAGKSTLCGKVFASQQTKSKWLGMEEAKAIATQSAIMNAMPAISLKRRLIKIFHLLSRCDSIRCAENFADCHSPFSLPLLKDKLMETFTTFHDSFLEALAEQWHDPDTEMPPRFERFNKVRKWVSELLFITTFLGESKLLADNARLTKGMSELLSNRDVKDAEKIVSHYCRSPLAPSGIIHLAGNPKTIVERSQQRLSSSGTVNPGHSSKSGEEIALYTDKRNAANKRAVRFFEQEKIAVLNLSAETPVDTNLNLTLNFLSNLKRD
jgi:hypothetical protein